MSFGGLLKYGLFIVFVYLHNLLLTETRVPVNIAIRSKLGIINARCLIYGKVYFKGLADTTADYYPGLLEYLTTF